MSYKSIAGRWIAPVPAFRVPCICAHEIQIAATVILLQLLSAGVMAEGQSSPSVKSISCNYVTYLGTGPLPCSVKLTAAAGASGLTVALVSDNVEAKVPASLNIAAGATSAAFTAQMATGLTTQIATLTATGGGGIATYSIKLWGNQYEIGLNNIGLSALAISFGNVAVNSPATQSLDVKSVGKDALTVSSASVTGSGFSLKGAALPVTVPPGSKVTWDLEFDPTSAGSRTGTLTIQSNSIYRGTATVALSGAGEAIAYSVELSWNAPTGTPIAGYQVYRATSGSSSYQLQNSSMDTATSYTDNSVQDGVTYDYYVESVDSAGVSSSPSAVVAIAVP